MFRSSSPTTFLSGQPQTTCLKTAGPRESNYPSQVEGRKALASKVQNIGQRAELYNLFDSLPLEDLLQLRVPLGWVLKVIRDKG